MVDISSHRVVDMINSRDHEDVVEWLNTYPNIKVVARDGSITYANAIKAAHPYAIQVNDRFHLLKNLTTYCKDYLTKILKSSVIITATKIKGTKDNIPTPTKEIRNKMITLKEKYQMMDEMLEKGYCKTQICKKLNMDVRTFDKLQSMNENERNKAFQSNKHLKHEETVANKQAVVNEAREMFKNGFSKRAIARELKLARKTVQKYLDPDFSPIHANYGTKRKSILEPYFNEINEYIIKGYTSIKIEELIRTKGYTGSSSTIRHYISNWKSTQRDSYESEKAAEKKNVERIERKILIKLLYKPINKVKKLSKEQLDQVFVEYPIYAKVIEIVEQFRKILAEKKVNKLDQWIETASSLKINEIDSFINGLNRDIEAVKNAIIYDYNNGLAEGSVNKIKVIKRIMYGRCRFETLRRKVLRLEFLRKFN